MITKRNTVLKRIRMRLVSVSLFLFSSVPVVMASSAAKPNVVVIVTDDQGTLDVNCYGSKDLHTPNMDAIAANGIRFTQAYAHSVCCPARAALMTGRHSQRVGINSWSQRSINVDTEHNMHADEITLGEVFQSSGYKTALFGKWHLGAHRDLGPKKQGFDEFFGLRDGFIDNFVHFHLHRDGFHDLFEGTREVFMHGRYFPELMVTRAEKFIKQNRKHPFLLYVGFNIPHYPEQPLPEHAKLYEGMDEPRKLYASFITTTDYYVGRVMAQLEKYGLTEDTIVLFLSDNGHSVENYVIEKDNHSSGYPKGYDYGSNGGGGNTGKWIGNKGTFLEGGIRTPAILSWPGHVAKGETRGAVVTALDWLPTLCELAGVVQPDAKLDGHSILPIIESSDAVSKHKALYFQWQEKWAVREADWKLIYMPDDGGKLSLHNLGDEKPEVHDYVSEKPEVVRRLKGLYDTWAADVFAPRP